MTFREEIQKAYEAKKRQDEIEWDRKFEEHRSNLLEDWTALFGEGAIKSISCFDRNRKRFAFSIEGMIVSTESWDGRSFLDYKLINKCQVCGEEFEVMLRFRRTSPEQQEAYRHQNLSMIGEALEAKHTPYKCKQAQEAKEPITTEGRLIEALDAFVRERVPESD